MISNEALPEPTIIPAFKVVSAKLELDRMVSTFFLMTNALIVPQRC